MSVLVPTVVPCVSTATSRQKRSKDSPRRPAAMRIAASMPPAKFSGVDGDLVAVIRPPRSSATQSVNVPPMSTPTRRLGTWLLLRVGSSLALRQAQGERLMVGRAPGKLFAGEPFVVSLSNHERLLIKPI